MHYDAALMGGNNTAMQSEGPT